MSIGTILSIFGAAHSYSSSNDAARKVKEAGEASAQLSELETAEQVRRYKYQVKQEQGSRIVAAAKSGVVLQGTPLTVMREAANVADREVVFMEEQGIRTAEARRKGASIQAADLQTQGTSLLISNVQTIGQQNDWWDL